VLLIGHAQQGAMLPLFLFHRHGLQSDKFVLACLTWFEAGAAISINYQINMKIL